MGRNYFNMVSKLCLLLAFALAIISFACAPRKAVAPEVKTVEKPQATAIKVELSWEQEWEDLIKAAQKEGKFTIYSGMTFDAASAVRKHFGEKYGIKAEILTMKTATLPPKIYMERQAGLYIPDLYIEGPPVPLLHLKPRGILQSLDKLVFRPDVLEEKLWGHGFGPFFDREHYVAAGSNNVSVPVTFNTKMVRPEELTSYNDLLEPQWKGKIILADPTISGSEQQSMMGALVIMGEDYIRKLSQQVGMMISGDKRLVVESVARGKYPIAFGAGSSTTVPFMREGANLDLIAFKEGSPISSSGVIAFFDRAPNPNAARLFINWFLTREGQQVYSLAVGRASRRLDVSDDHLISAERKKEGVKYVFGDQEFYLRSPEYIPIIEKYYKVR